MLQEQQEGLGLAAEPELGHELLLRHEVVAVAEALVIDGLVDLVEALVEYKREGSAAPAGPVALSCPDGGPLCLRELPKKTTPLLTTGRDNDCTREQLERSNS